MKNRILIFGLVVLYASCEKKQDNQIIDNSVSNFVLVTGESINDSLNYHEFNPIIKVKGLRIGTDSNFVFHDSVLIDLNSDGLNDLKFLYSSEFHQPNCNCEGIDCCMPWGYSDCLIKQLSDIEIASIDFMGIRPTRLSFGDTIDNRLIWVKFDNAISFSSWGLNNSWNRDYYNSFMAFRKIIPTDTLYGWIRLNTFQSNKIELYDYVIKKYINR